MPKPNAPLHMVTLVIRTSMKLALVHASEYVAWNFASFTRIENAYDAAHCLNSPKNDINLAVGQPTGRTRAGDGFLLLNN